GKDRLNSTNNCRPGSFFSIIDGMYSLACYSIVLNTDTAQMYNCRKHEYFFGGYCWLRTCGPDMSCADGYFCDIPAGMKYGLCNRNETTDSTENNSNGNGFGYRNGKYI